jgi:23S rRNA (pseudouridine1915-N3)-methyltransferase
MQRVVFLYVGRVKTTWIAEGFDHYLHRLKNQLDFDPIEMVASKNVNEQKMRDEESAVILKKLDNLEGEVWLLDEKGKGMTSVDFSKMLEGAKDMGNTIIFVLGGAYGVNEEVRKRAKGILQLSQMTFPHEFCALIFLEQLYRAVEIQKDSGYHH